MKQKTVCYTEMAYVYGILALAVGTAFMERADFGMSMVVAPAYLLHRVISQTLPFYSFGMSEYILQAVLLLVLSLVMGRFRKSYLFSFVTAVIYGFTLDLAIRAVGLLPWSGMIARIVFYAAGLLVCALGVAFFFRTYLSPEAYELFVKELAGRLHRDVSRVKTVYDCCSCLVGLILSFAFFGFGHFVGVKAGTILCALVNGSIIGWIGRAMDRRLDFRDGLPWRRAFEE